MIVLATLKNVQKQLLELNNLIKFDIMILL